MRRLLIITLLLIGYCVVLPMWLSCHAQVPAEELYTPDSSTKYAAGDLISLPPDVQPYIRYLSLYNIPKAERKEMALQASFVINSLSRRRKVYIPVFVGASNETVIRVNLRDYDIDPRVWDELGEKGSGPSPFPEPYFHAFVEKISIHMDEKIVRKERKIPTGQYVWDGTKQVPQYRTEFHDVVEKTEGKPTRKFELLPAPWLDSNTTALLVRGTSSQFPIFRADWFIVYSMLEPEYHKFLGLGDKEKDFENLVFANEELAKKARSQDKAVVVNNLRMRTFFQEIDYFTTLK